MLHKKEISIIIPHKNSPELLLRLLNSIPENPTFQAIVIDDASNNDSIVKLRSFDHKSNVVFHYLEQNKGAGYARNFGLKIVESKWIIFADADDYFTEDMELILGDNIDDSCDIIYFDTTSIFSDGSLAYRHEEYSLLVNQYISESTTRNEENLRYKFTPPWAKLYRKNFLDSFKLNFEEIPASNDINFTVKSGHYAKKIKAVREVLYVISVTDGSITNSVNQVNLDSKLSAALRINKFLRKVNKKEYQHSVLYFIYKSFNYSLILGLKTIFRIIKNGSNPFIGIEKIVRFKEVIRLRETR